MKKQIAVLLLLFAAIGALTFVIWLRSRPDLEDADQAMRQGDMAEARRVFRRMPIELSAQEK